MNDGSPAGQCGAGTDAGHRRFRDRHVDDPVVAKSILQPAHLAAALTSDVLAQYDDRLIARHFLDERFVQRLGEGEVAGHSETPAGKPG